jgi:hypothetical protein
MRQTTDLEWAASSAAGASWVRDSITSLWTAAWAPHPRTGLVIGEQSFDELQRAVEKERALPSNERKRTHLNKPFDDSYALEYVERYQTRCRVFIFNVLGPTVLADVAHEAARIGGELVLPATAVGASPMPTGARASQLAAHQGRILYGSGHRANQRAWQRYHPRLDITITTEF